jgi:hypothetical protein
MMHGQKSIKLCTGSLCSQNKFGNLVHLVGFIIKKFVTMHGHMNVKKYIKRSLLVRRRDVVIIH